jgi:hypothetical protein
LLPKGTKSIFRHIRLRRAGQMEPNFNGKIMFSAWCSSGRILAFAGLADQV